MKKKILNTSQVIMSKITYLIRYIHNKFLKSFEATTISYLFSEISYLSP